MSAPDDELHRLQEENRLLREVIAASPAHFCVYNERNELVAWDEAYERGHPAPFESHEAGAAAVRRACAGLGVEHVMPRATPNADQSGMLRRPDAGMAEKQAGGDPVIRRYEDAWLRVHRYALPSGGVADLAVDVTDLVERENELIAARAAAEAGERAKAAFLANMSHEIRTPMNGVIGVASLLRGTALDDDQRGLVDTILRSADALLAVINDVLDFSKIDAGRLKLRPAPFNLGVLAGDVLSLMSPVAREKGLALRIDAGADADGWFTGDAGRVRQCLLNLVGNAIKFTARGEVVITLSRAATGESVIAVHDTGIGIAPDKIGLIFSAFEQVECERARRIEGTGLGLAITDRLVRLQGGAIEVASVQGSGSTFTMTLPLQPCAAPQYGADTAGPEDRVVALAGTLTGRTILLAEDNEVNQMVFRRMLEPSGAQIVICGDGAAAVELYEIHRPELVLMDVSMPILNGVEATRKIRALEARIGAEPAPILALTADVTPEHQDQCRDAGASDVLSKPIRAEELLEAVARWRKDEGAARQLHRA